MTGLGLRPYQAGNDPPPGSVPVSVVVLTLNEDPNVRRCLASVAWADQVVVVDSGSTDDTVPVARSLGAEVVEQAWLGFSAQREFSLRLPVIRHDWVYFVDADEWVCPQLAAEIAARLADPDCAGIAHRLRLVFMGTWIRHCGWYPGSWVVRLVDRRYTKYDGSVVGERACVDGQVRRLNNDIVHSRAAVDAILASDTDARDLLESHRKLSGAFKLLPPIPAVRWDAQIAAVKTTAPPQ